MGSLLFVLQAILRLTTLKDWLEGEVFTNHHRMRGGAYNVADRAFDAKINECSHEADAHYANMAFKDALRFGFYEMWNARDVYRMMSGACDDPMLYHKDLVLKFAEVRSGL